MANQKKNAALDRLRAVVAQGDPIVEVRARQTGATVEQLEREQAEAEARYDFTKPAAALAHELVAKDVTLPKATKKAPKVKVEHKPLPVEPTPEERKAAHAAKHPPKPAIPPRPVCSKLKADGTPCTARCILKDGEIRDYCTDHRPASEHLNADELNWVCRKVYGYDAAGVDHKDATYAGLNWVIEQIGWGRVRNLARTSNGGAQ